MNIPKPTEALNEVPENAIVKEAEKDNLVRIKNNIRNKIYEHIRTRTFFFLTQAGHLNNSLKIGFPADYEKHHELFKEIKAEMELEGWKCYPQFSSCAYGTYYLFLIHSEEFNASTIKFTTNNSLTDFLYE